jgi:hypothetical protein
LGRVEVLKVSLSHSYTLRTVLRALLWAGYVIVRGKISDLPEDENSNLISLSFKFVSCIMSTNPRFEKPPDVQMNGPEAHGDRVVQACLDKLIPIATVPSSNTNRYPALTGDSSNGSRGSTQSSLHYDCSVICVEQTGGREGKQDFPVQ